MQPLTLRKFTRNFSLAALICSASFGTSQAANFTTIASQAAGQNWNGTIWDPGQVAPTAGNTYEAIDNGVPFGNNQANTRIRNPAAAGVQTFPGDSLTLNTNTEIRAKAAGAILNFPGVGGQPGLILNGGSLNAGDDAVFGLSGNIFVKANSFIAPADGGAGAVKDLRGFNISGKISGTNSIIIYQAGIVTPQEISGANNPFSGTWLLKAGWLKGSAPGSLGNANIVIDPLADVGADASVVPVDGPAQLEVNYDILSFGTLTLTNGGTMILHQDCTFTAATIEGVALTKGKHTYAELSAAFPTSFAAGGSGSISVIPHFTTKVVQGSGANWNGLIWQPGTVAPAANGTYEALDNGTPFGASKNNTRLRNPATAGVQTFPGDSLTLGANTEIRAKQAGAILDFPGVNGQPGLILNGGFLNAGDDTVFTITGSIQVAGTSYIVPGDNGGGAVKPLRGFNIAGKLSGGGKLVVMNAGTNVAQEISGTANTFNGEILVKAGWLKGSGAGSLGTNNITLDPKAVLGLDASIVDVQGPAWLEAGYNLTSPDATLTVTNGGVVILHQDLTFKAVTIQGTAVTRGTHPYAELAAAFPANFATGGSGSITVLAATAQFTTKAVQGSGANWNGLIWEPGFVAPAAGATYVALDNGTPFGASKNNTRLRNPATAGVQTFPGDSLTLKANTEIRAKQAGAILNFPAVNGNPGLILDGGNLNAGDDTVFQITGKIGVNSTSYIVPGDNGGGAIKPLRGFNIAGQLVGTAPLVIYQAGTNVAQEISGANNPFAGTFVVKAGRLKGSAVGSLGTANIVIDPKYAMVLDASIVQAEGPAVLEITYPINTTGTLFLNNGGMVWLSQDLTFDKVVIDGSRLDAGTHPYAELAASYPANFPAGGSGSITVITGPGHFTTTVTQAAGTDWNALIWQPGNVSPAPGNIYEALDNGTAYGNAQNNTRLRNPAVAGVQTFPGDVLILNTNTELRAKAAGAILNFPGVGGKPGLILNGGNLNTGDDATFMITGKILVQGTSYITPADQGAGAVLQNRAFNIAAQLTGSATLVLYQGGTTLPQIISGNANTFSGDWIVTAGWLQGRGVNSLGTGNITIDPFLDIGYPPSVTPANGPAQLEIQYEMVSPGKLTLINGGMMILNTNVTFKTVEIEGTLLANGVHPYDELVANFPGNFAPNGSGAIIVKEPTVPAVPTNLAAVDGDTSVGLSWSSSPGATGYVVSRGSAAGGPYTPITLVVAPSFNNTGLVNGTIYYYVVASSNMFGVSANSTEVAARPSPPVVGVAAVGSLSGITLNWTAFSGAASYRVMRGTVAGGPYTAVATGVTTTSYVDTALQPGTRYYYRVVAQLTVGFDSAASAEVNAVSAPSQPFLSVSLYSTIGAPLSSVRLRLSTVDKVGPSFQIERSLDGVNFTALATTTTNKYNDNSLSLGASYTYRVRSQNASGLSAYTDPVKITLPTSASFIGVNFANAINGTPANNQAPAINGYFQDVGEVFGDRGNGATYGWDRDITPDGRWRQNANSPDARYDTFIHLEKALPSAIWEIQIANGDYLVHIGAGDATAIDGTFQFDVEGALTGAYAPATGDWFNDFTVRATVADGALTINSGPLAGNNKIDFVEIYAAPPADAPKLTITSSGGNITVTWTNGGTLQSRTDFNAGTWTDLGTSGSYTELAPTGNKYFRVVR